MAREKVTITLDRAKGQAAVELLAADSVSQAIDVALDRLIHSERLRRDVAIYASGPSDQEDVLPSGVPLQLDLDDDDVDYAAQYATRS